MARYASGKKSQAISDISGAKVPYTQLKTTWNNLRVEPSEFDPKHPQLTPAKNVIDATALYDPRPSTDVENVVIDFAFTSNIFLSRVERSQIGTNIHSRGNVGTVSFVIEEEQTGVQGVGAIGSAAAGFDVSGVQGTGAIGTVVAQDQIDVSPSGTVGTTAIGDYQTGAVTTGVQATSATGTETIEHDRIFDLPNGGVSGTGDTGTESFDTSTGTISSVVGTGTINNTTVGNEPNATGVQATGGIGTFGEEGDGTLNLTITPVSATGTANAGAEVAESEIPETNTNGWGEQAWGDGVWGGDEEVRGTGGVGSSTIDIFNGPNPQSGVVGTSNIGAYLIQGDLNVIGLTGTGAIGTSTFFIETAIPVTGVAGTTAVGDETARVNPGFGEGAWNDDTWGN